MRKSSLILLCCMVLMLAVGTMVSAQSVDNPSHSGRIDSNGPGGAGGGRPTPVPEPATLITFGLGAAGVYLAGRKMRIR